MDADRMGALISSELLALFDRIRRLLSARLHKSLTFSVLVGPKRSLSLLDLLAHHLGLVSRSLAILQFGYHELLHSKSGVGRLNRLSEVKMVREVLVEIF